MAENPAQWGEATKVIAHCLIDYTKELNEMRERRGDPPGIQREDFRAGNSGPFRIAKALQEAGFLDMEDIWIDNTTPEHPEFVDVSDEIQAEYEINPAVQRTVERMREGQ